MKGEQATVYRLSATLQAVRYADGRVWLQRNDREPLRLTASEAKNLRAVSFVLHGETDA